MALETFLTRGLCVVGGELTTNAYVEIADVVRDTIVEVGYTTPTTASTAIPAA